MRIAHCVSNKLTRVKHFAGDVKIWLSSGLLMVFFLVCALRKRQLLGTWDAEEGDEVVTEGWWGFPTYLPNAKYPFLCVQAHIKSTLQPATPKCIGE